jgi:hypothetical protein
MGPRQAPLLIREGSVLTLLSSSSRASTKVVSPWQISPLMMSRLLYQMKGIRTRYSTTQFILAALEPEDLQRSDIRSIIFFSSVCDKHIGVYSKYSSRARTRSVPQPRTRSYRSDSRRTSRMSFLMFYSSFCLVHRHKRFTSGREFMSLAAILQRWLRVSYAQDYHLCR